MDHVDAVHLDNFREHVIVTSKINTQVTGIPGVASYGTTTDNLLLTRNRMILSKC